MHKNRNTRICKACFIPGTSSISKGTKNSNSKPTSIAKLHACSNFARKSLSCDKNHFLILTKIDQKNTLNMCLIFRFFLFFIFQFAELTWFTKQRRRIEILAKKKPKKRKTKKLFFSWLNAPLSIKSQQQKHSM